MAKIGFVMSMILTVLGILLLAVGLLVHALLPTVGYMAFQIGGGSYSAESYEPSPMLWVYYALVVSCVVVGAMLSIRFCKAEQASHRIP